MENYYPLSWTEESRFIYFRKVSSVISLVVLLLTVFLFQAHGQSPSKDKGWFGMNNEDFKSGDLNRATQFITYDQELGVGSVRIGYDAGSRDMGLKFDGAAANWTKVDAYTQKYLDAGLAIHAVIAPATVDCGGNYDQFERNYRYFVRQLVTHYKNKIRWYIIGNEDDINRDCFGNAWTPANTYRMIKAAYEEIKAIDSGIIVESNPLSSPLGGNYMRSLVQLGVTNYCDVLGTHAYNAQIYHFNNDGSYNEIAGPWKIMQEEGARIVPVVNSEASGASVFANVQYPEGHVNWYRYWAYRQFKRFGYSHVILFDLDNSGTVSNPDAAGNSWGIYPGTTTYNELKNRGFIRKTLTNNGFESSNDLATEWIKDPANENEVKFPLNPVTTGGARTGNGLLKVNGSASRVVEFLTPGATYTLEVYAYAESGTARLRAEGFDHLNGIRQEVRTTSSTGNWQKLSLTFRPTKTWVVISLRGDGGTARFDDISLSTGGGSNPGSPILANGIYKLTSKVSVNGSPVKVLDVDDGKDINGANVQIWSQTTDPAFINNQRFYLEHLGNNVYKIISQVGSKTRVLDVNGGPTAKANGSNVHLWEYRGNGNQQWKIESVGNGYYKLVANHTANDSPRKVLDVSGGSNTDGANVQIWQELNNDAQQWRIESASAARLSAETPQESLPQVMLYPNPATHQVTVVTQADQAASVELLNASGQSLRTATTKARRVTMSVAGLPAGLYLIKVVSSRGVAVHKLLVK